MMHPVEFLLWWAALIALAAWGFHVARVRSRRRWRELERAQVREEAAKARLAMRKRSLEDELRRERERTNYLVGEIAEAKANAVEVLSNPTRERYVGGAR